MEALERLELEGHPDLVYLLEGKGNGGGNGEKRKLSGIYHHIRKNSKVNVMAIADQLMGSASDSFYQELADDNSSLIAENQALKAENKQQSESIENLQIQVAQLRSGFHISQPRIDVFKNRGVQMRAHENSSDDENVNDDGSDDASDSSHLSSSTDGDQDINDSDASNASLSSGDENELFGDKNNNKSSDSVDCDGNDLLALLDDANDKKYGDFRRLNMDSPGSFSPPIASSQALPGRLSMSFSSDDGVYMSYNPDVPLAPVALVEETDQQLIYKLVDEMVDSIFLNEDICSDIFYSIIDEMFDNMSIEDTAVSQQSSEITIESDDEMFNVLNELSEASSGYGTKRDTEICATNASSQSRNFVRIKVEEPKSRIKDTVVDLQNIKKRRMEKKEALIEKKKAKKELYKKFPKDNDYLYKPSSAPKPKKSSVLSEFNLFEKSDKMMKKLPDRKTSCKSHMLKKVKERNDKMNKSKMDIKKKIVSFSTDVLKFPKMFSPFKIPKTAQNTRSDTDKEKSSNKASSVLEEDPAGDQSEDSKCEN